MITTKRPFRKFKTPFKKTMSQIILIKPGSTDYDEQGRIQGNLDIPLNARGADDVEKLADSLDSYELETIYSSPCEPALETAQALSKLLGVKLKKIGKLENVDLGLWQGMKTEEVRRKQQRVYRQWQEHPETVCPPDGETIDDARRRMEGALAKVLKRHREGTIGLVIPEPMASLVRQFLLGNDSQLGDLWAATADRPMYESFKLEPVNGDSHFEGSGVYTSEVLIRSDKVSSFIVKPASMTAE